MLRPQVLGVLVHLAIVIVVIASATVITIVEHGQLPTSVGGLLGAALGISATNVGKGADNIVNGNRRTNDVP